MMEFHNCPHLYDVPGIKIGKDSNYPERVWGSYLPGDEPGTCCDITKDPCDGNVELSDCAKMKQTNILCPCNFEDEDIPPIEDITLWFDTDTRDYYCPEEDLYYSNEGIDFSKTVKGA